MDGIARKVARRLRKVQKDIGYHLLLAKTDLPMGTSSWLISTEKHFGGFHTDVSRNKVSPHDPRTQEQLARGGMTGGDRMYYHGYAAEYEKGLRPFVVRRDHRFTIVETGILKGVGLATWSVLFPNSDIIGLDIDLGHTKQNLNLLKSRGAFPKKEPELYEFDQFSHGASRIAEVLAGRKVDIMIDDGYHSVETIVNTARALSSHLADDFIYFIEDNDEVASILSEEFPDWRVRPVRELTIMSKSS